MSFREQTNESYANNQALIRRTFGDGSWAGSVYVGDTPPANAAAIEMVGEQLFAQYDDHCGNLGEATPNTAEFGFTVVARGIARCTEAYEAYCEGSAQAPQTDEVIAGLTHPKTARFATMAAGMQRGKNREFEVWFGLKEMGRNVSTNEMVFNPDIPCFDPDPELLETVEKEIKKWALRNQETDDMSDPAPKRCPGLPIIPKLWEITVRACADANVLNFKQLDIL